MAYRRIGREVAKRVTNRNAAENRHPLRSGYTTGTCAAAAAKAAVCLLAEGKKRETVSVRLPGGGLAFFTPKSWSVREDGREAAASVRKDAGDDPDVTDQAIIVCHARLLGKNPAGKSWYCSERFPNIFLSGGEGVGLVTKKGLLCPVGYPAINPVPRQMIFEAAQEALAECGQGLPGRRDCLLLKLIIPGGEKLAQKTFNPNLGIVGGLSVLGTTGIVNPMSEQALLETIRLDIRVRAAEGRRWLAVAPGNYGENFLKNELGLSMDSFIKCSNFVGEAFHMMKEERVEAALFAAHLGKLIKVAGGVLNTHSKNGDRRMEILAACARESGAPALSEKRLLQMNTTEEAAAFLKEEGLLEQTAKRAVQRVKQVLEGQFGIATEVIVFTGNLGILAMTQEAEALSDKIRKDKPK